MIPVTILQRIEEFMATGKTGCIALNFFQGELRNADVREHIRVKHANCIDKPAESVSVMPNS